MGVAQCSVCGVSDAGLGGTPLVKYDNVHYCRGCLAKTKGLVKCSHCGRPAFSTNASYATVNGTVVCSLCAAAAGAAVPTAQATAAGAVGAAQLGWEVLNGSLPGLLKQAMLPGEEIRFAINGASGEALVLTDKRVVILKTGVVAQTVGTGLQRAFTLGQVTSIELVCGLAYGRIQLTAPGTADLIHAEISQARQADNVVTFLAVQKAKFEAAAEYLRRSLLKKVG